MRKMDHIKSMYNSRSEKIKGHNWIYFDHRLSYFDSNFAILKT